jgi:hypothetical protein
MTAGEIVKECDESMTTRHVLTGIHDQCDRTVRLQQPPHPGGSRTV